MEQTRNVKQMSIEELYGSLLKNVMDNGELSSFTKEVVRTNSIDFTQYDQLLSEIMSKIKYFDDYFKCNIPNIDDYGTSSLVYLQSSVNHHPVRSHVFGRITEDSTYILYAAGFPGEMHVSLKKSLELREAFQKNQGIISIRVFPPFEGRDKLVFNKNFVGNGICCREIFEVGNDSKSRVINTNFYDVNSIINGIDTSRCIMKMMAWESAIEPGNYSIICMNEGIGIYPTGSHYEVIEGDSLYSAYYNFMVRNGYFDEISQKRKRNSK